MARYAFATPKVPSAFLVTPESSTTYSVGSLENVPPVTLMVALAASLILVKSPVAGS